MLSEGYQTRAFSLLAIASMSGCCQVTLPLVSRERCPVSVSFIARHGGDLFLLSTVEAMYTSLQEQADMASKSYLSSNVISQEESAEIAKEKNVKAFLRRGTAREMLGYYKEAIEDFGYALVLEPTKKTANLAVNRLRKLFQ
eukprot:TRINITY_DN18285_c0_g1_i1.p1 TRINITY_DN18285_c0_g1~~TRINITY_DN18285_c0_g1_i1.p1  ORF type:complete len:142 (-),score=30.74 TRINITY_DN18285_c0_g1_i1:503-928(-)